MEMESNGLAVSLSLSNGTHRENGHVPDADCIDKYAFSNLPYREPIDLQFKDITYTVKMGWNHGKSMDFFSK